MSSRRRIWAAVVSIGWAALFVQLFTMEWTPDCGGLSYGTPLPFATAFMGSSQEFDVYLGPLLLDVACYAMVLAIPVWAILRGVGSISGRARRLSLVIAVTPYVAALLLGATWSLGVHPVLSRHQPLYVREWRTRRLHLGPPRWATHLEDACN